MGTIGEDAKQRVADVINAAINAVLADGSGNGNVLACLARIEKVLEKTTPDAKVGAAQLQEYNRALFTDLVRNRGFQTRSAISVGIADDCSESEAPHDLTPAEFVNVLPALRGLFEHSVQHTVAVAERSRSSEILEALGSFRKWANRVPPGGTKDKSYRAAARETRGDVKVVMSWVKHFLVIHRTDFTSEVTHLFACKRGAIAGRWQFDAYSCNVHKALNGHVFVARDGWAVQKDYLNSSKCRFFDEMPVPGSDGCLCYYDYLYELNDLPPGLAE